MDWAVAAGANMNEYWEKVRHYYLTHDDIEMFLFACIFALLGWAGYHAIVAIVEKLTG